MARAVSLISTADGIDSTVTEQIQQVHTAR